VSTPELDPLPTGFTDLLVGDKIAFTEDHPEHPGMYGIIETIGLADGVLSFDVTVIDPATRETTEDPPVSYRATIEEVQ
jgi:hypothetical protein